MSESREDEEKKPLHRHDEGPGWMAEFEEDLRRMHVERRTPGPLTVLLGKLRAWWRRAR